MKKDFFFSFPEPCDKGFLLKSFFLYIFGWFVPPSVPSRKWSLFDKFDNLSFSFFHFSELYHFALWSSFDVARVLRNRNKKVEVLWKRLIVKNESRASMFYAHCTVHDCMSGAVFKSESEWVGWVENGRLTQNELKTIDLHGVDFWWVVCFWFTRLILTHF